MAARVVVIGGGYGGIAVARALDDVAEVTLVEPRDTFVHNVAALRALVDPGWTDRLFLPYDRLLTRGIVVRDRAELVEDGAVTLGSGKRILVDHIVLATGSTYPFPAKFDDQDRAAAASRLHALRVELERAAHVLLLGAGPVGLELAGEITAAWPRKRVTIVDPQPDIVSGAYSAEFRAEIRRQLEALGVELLLGTSVQTPPTAPGQASSFTVVTASGASISADIWFRCYGVEPTTGYLADDLAALRTSSGALPVTEHLALPGHPTVFAIGDLTAIDEAKTAKAAGQHATVVAANIRAMINASAELITHEPGPAGISLPLGPHGGASYAPGTGVLDAETTSRMKGTGMRLDSYRQLLGLHPAHAPATGQ